MLRFKKKVFGGYNYKSKIFVIGYRIAGREDRVGEPSRYIYDTQRQFLFSELTRKPFCESGGSRGQFAGLMDALHPFPSSDVNNSVTKRYVIMVLVHI